MDSPGGAVHRTAVRGLQRVDCERLAGTAQFESRRDRRGGHRRPDRHASGIDRAAAAVRSVGSAAGPATGRLARGGWR